MLVSVDVNSAYRYSMETNKPFTSFTSVIVLLSIFESCCTATHNFVDQLPITALLKTPIKKFYTIKILRNMAQVMRNTLNTLRSTAEYISLVTMNMCFGIVIIFLIVKHVVQNINIYEPKYYTLAIF